jgi:hypothetical protein
MGVSAAAWACGEECVDADEAFDYSLREGRDPVEGFWGIYLDWNPDPGTVRHYRAAIVKNKYGVYPEADYIGVATCGGDGCQKGEIKLLLTKIPDAPDEFSATIMTKGGGARGRAILTNDPSDGRERCALDTRDVKYDGRVVASWMLRVIDG